MTLKPVAERLALELSLPILVTKVCRSGPRIECIKNEACNELAMKSWLFLY